MTTAKKKKLATVRNPTIEAVVKQLLRLPDEQSALGRLESLRAYFVTSNKQITETKTPSVLLWIKGFEVSNAELAKGYHGHFAVVTYKRLPDGKYTLTATKITMDLKHHPERKYQPVRQRHPNWGHPVLRKIKKNLPYATIEDAAVLLVKLHEEYPDASIPGEMKLYLMIFDRTDDGRKPIKKWIFEIKPTTGEQYIIEYRENIHTSPLLKPKAHDVAKDNPIMGYFTAKAAVRRRRKPKV
jgi:hypothetical protein